jgi:hypothetical protein
MRVVKEYFIENEDDFELWCKNESWNCEDIIDDIDDHNGWGEVWEYIEPYLSDEMTEVEMNDFVRFELDEMIDFMRSHDEDDDLSRTDLR